MSFLDALGSFASHALPAATNVLAARKQADAQAAADQRAQLLQQSLMMRQQQDDDLKRQLMQSQARQYDARANALANPATKLTYKVAADGSLYALPASLAPGAQPGQGVTPVSTGVKAPTPAVKAQSTIPGTPEWKAAQIEAAKIRAQYRPPPAPDRVLIQTVGPDGSPVLTPRSQAVGKTPYVKPATASGNEQNKLTGARARAAIGEMNNADPQMAEFEEKLKTGTANISGLDQYLNAVGNDFVENKSPAKQATALAILNRKNPELARYIRRGLSFAEGESQLSSRPSDFRTKMAAFLSTAVTGAPPEMIDDIRTRRSAILTQVNAVYPDVKANTGNTGGGGSSGAPSADLAHRQSLWDQAVAKYGEAKVLQEVGPRPKQ